MRLNRISLVMLGSMLAACTGGSSVEDAAADTARADSSAMDSTPDAALDTPRVQDVPSADAFDAADALDSVDSVNGADIVDSASSDDGSDGAIDTDAAFDAASEDVGPPTPCAPAPERVLADPGAGVGLVSITASGAEFGVVWQARNSLKLARLDAAGVMIGAEHVLESPIGATTLRVNAGAAGFGVVYEDFTGAIRFVRADRAGTLAGSPVTLAMGHAPEIAWSGSSWGVVYSSADGAIRFQRVGADGTPGTPVVISTPMTTNGPPVLAWDGSHFGVAWSDFFAPMNPVSFALLAADGSVVATPVQISPASSSPIVIAAGAEGFAVLHRDRVASTTTALRLDRTGVPLAPLALAGVPDSVVWDGSSYAAVIAHAPDMGALDLVNFGSTGSASAPRVITTSTAARNAQVASTGSAYGVVWADARSRPNDAYVSILCPL